MVTLSTSTSLVVIVSGANSKEPYSFNNIFTFMLWIQMCCPSSAKVKWNKEWNSYNTLDYFKFKLSICRINITINDFGLLNKINKNDKKEKKRENIF